jgi:hypothetical protein
MDDMPERKGEGHFWLTNHSFLLTLKSDSRLLQDQFLFLPPALFCRSNQRMHILPSTCHLVLPTRLLAVRPVGFRRPLPISLLQLHARPMTMLGSSDVSNANPPPAKRQKLHGRAFWESIGSPKFILAPMVDQSEFVCRPSRHGVSESVTVDGHSKSLPIRLIYAHRHGECLLALSCPRLSANPY